MQSDKHNVSMSDKSDVGRHMLSSDKTCKTLFNTMCMKFVLQEMS